MKKIFLIIFFINLLAGTISAGECYWEQDVVKIEEAVRRIDGLIETLIARKPLSKEQRRFMFPDTASDEGNSFFELNFDNENVRRLREVVKDSGLSAREKEDFLRRTTLRVKRREWDELVVNAFRLPLIFPPKIPDKSPVSKEKLRELTEEVSAAKEAWINALRNKKSAEELLECKKRLAACVFEAFPCSLDVFDRDVRILYEDFHHAVFDGVAEFS